MCIGSCGKDAIWWDDVGDGELCRGYMVCNGGGDIYWMIDVVKWFVDGTGNGDMFWLDLVAVFGV